MGISFIWMMRPLAGQGGVGAEMQFQPDYSLFTEITGFLQDGGVRLGHDRANSNRVVSYPEPGGAA
jgi:hypothetical protein